MNYLVYNTHVSTYPVCILVSAIHKAEILNAYLKTGINPDDVLVMDLHHRTRKKTPVAEIKAYLKEELVPELVRLGVQHVLVTDSDYFKVLAGVAKAEAHLGYVLPSSFGSFKVVYAPSYKAIFYDPVKVKAKIAQAVDALVADIQGQYANPGEGIIKFSAYPRTNEKIQQWLDKLLAMDCDLTCDIEAFSLKHHTAGIGTITFCWNQHEGIAFAVDYQAITGATEAPYGKQVFNVEVRAMLLNFFLAFKRKMIYHNIAYDVYNMIYNLFMVDILDTESLLDGMDVMLRNWECTKLITYLATNSCAGNKLGLKAQAQEFSGNYGMEDIHDITKIPLNKLLEYNLVDGLSTWFTYHKHWDTLVADQQEEIYQTLFKPATLDIIQMQLTGLPLNMERVKEVKAILQAIEDQATSVIQQSPLVQQYTHHLREKHVAKRNSELKKKQITMADAEVLAVNFNPNSGPQLQELLFEMVGLPVISYTDSKQPGTDGDTLKALQNHTQDSDVLSFLGSLIDYKAVNKLLVSFIPAFEEAVQGPDGWHYLFGSFNLGGTVSGRLSSSNPNMQNLPANIVMTISAALLTLFEKQLEGFVEKGKLNLGKLIKSCFQAPPGWLFCGLDFASLEDRISALTTKDPNKLKVYTDGYDGHSMRAFSYFGDQMPDIVDTVESINSIEHKYKHFRQDSKAPTFALTYQGTYKTLMTNCGFPIDKAKMVEAKYHILYKVSDDWVAAKLTEASKTGYIIAAFGLRVRTPLLHQVIRGNSKTPYEAEAEGRTAGNALGQSWCLLNSRASAEFMGKVRASKYRLDIRPCAHIHDAGYHLIRDNIGAIMFTNEHLVKAVEWQDHPDIAHDQVKLGGKLGIFWPSWKNEITIPNGASQEEIFSIIDKVMS